MMNDQKLMKWLVLLIALPLGLAIFGGDRFRYPCQDPDNWDTKQCQKPTCEATRTCPEHILKGGPNVQQSTSVVIPQRADCGPTAAPAPAVPVIKR